MWSRGQCQPGFMARDAHAGETAHIVGCGPSLAFLRAEHFGSGPVLAINDAIMPVQAFGLPNPLYALQKDGCFGGRACVCQGHPARVSLRPDVTLVVQQPYSLNCFPEHNKRLAIMDIRSLGFANITTVSARMGAAMARLMGCARLVFLCCDSLANGDTRRYDLASGQAHETAGSLHYLPNNKRLRRDLGSFPYLIFIPGEQV